MNAIQVRKSDIAWNYIGTIVSMSSNFVLLPLLLFFLSGDELGLWYVLVAIAGLAQLFEFGFTATFSRNIVYCVSGAQRLSSKGYDSNNTQEGINWHLLRTVFETSKTVYAFISAFALILLATAGTPYVLFVSSSFSGNDHLIAWAIFVVSIVLNLYFLYCTTFLRGLGDIASENKAKTWSRLAQLLFSAILLVMGFGIIAASVGFFVNGVLLRLLSMWYFRKHDDITRGIKADRRAVTKREKRDVFNTIIHISWRDGFVQLAWYASTQASTILCSIFFSLSATGVYSVLMQLCTAVQNISFTYTRTFYPAFQSAYAHNDKVSQRTIIQKGLSIFVALYWLAAIGVIVVVFPILPIFKPGLELDIPLFLGLTAYMFLYQQHSYFCNLIIGSNRIPFFKAYIIAAILGVVLTVFLQVVFGVGVWALVLGQALAQASYNNWKWPRFVLKELEMRYVSTLISGFKYWINRCKRIFVQTKSGEGNK